MRGKNNISFLTIILYYESNLKLIYQSFLKYNWMSIEKIKIVEKELPRPKLKNFSIENQIFQIPPHYKIDKILGTGAYGIVV